MEYVSAVHFAFTDVIKIWTVTGNSKCWKERQINLATNYLASPSLGKATTTNQCVRRQSLTLYLLPAFLDVCQWRMIRMEAL